MFPYPRKNPAPLPILQDPRIVKSKNVLTSFDSDRYCVVGSEPMIYVGGVGVSVNSRCKCNLFNTKDRLQKLKAVVTYCDELISPHSIVLDSDPLEHVINCGGDPFWINQSFIVIDGTSFSVPFDVRSSPICPDNFIHNEHHPAFKGFYNLRHSPNTKFISFGSVINKSQKEYLELEP